MKKITVTTVLLVFLPLWSAIAAYHHGGDTDSETALQAFPANEGTKLDSCALCHTGGEYEKKPGKIISMGSCQWCHYSYGYDGSGDIETTLNSYGEAYNLHGRTREALAAIEDMDSDQDGFTNKDEIAALRYPGDANDDPTKVAAPYRILTLEELEEMIFHSQIMLMNTHKSGDFYAEYGGVPMADLLKHVQILDNATGITVYAPDGWAQYHPLEEDSEPLMYSVNGTYPQADFHYDEEADVAVNTENGWCDYSSPALDYLTHGDPIEVDGGLRLLLAYARDNEYLQPGMLDEDNRLDGEGPFRVVPPQKLPGPPDQSVKSDAQNVIWPFDETADHNAGFATRSATIIKVDPLPEGTTDIDTLEAGWDYIDEQKIVIYGAIAPKHTVLLKIRALKHAIAEMDKTDFVHQAVRRILFRQIRILKKAVKRDRDAFAKLITEDLSSRADGCTNSGNSDENDWIIDCDKQLMVYWSLYELKVLLGQ